MLAVTGGIPFLVRLVDEILFPGGEERPGIDIALNEFEGFLVEFQKRLPDEIRRLTAGEVEVALKPREVELMRMIVGACREIGFDVTPKDLRDGLTVAWDDLRSTVFPNQTDCPVLPLMDQDMVPLQVLQELGLVPVDSHLPDDDPALRIMPLGRDDPLIRLVELLEADA